MHHMVEKPDVDDPEFSDEELVRILKNHGLDRRTLVRALGAGAAAAVLGSGTALAEGDGHGQHDQHGNQDPHDDPHRLDRQFGYAGSYDEQVPPRLEPDHTVSVHTDEGQFVRDDSGVPIAIEFGAFHFHDAGLAVDPGDIVKFDFVWPEHMVAAYHERMGRQRRVPEGVPSFASPVMSKGDFWLYRFDEPGVYDVFCPPHEEYGMAMRIVVGDGAEEFGPANPMEHERPPAGLSSTLLGMDELAPDAIRNAGDGAVKTEDLFGVEVPIPSATDETELGEVAVPLAGPMPADSL